MNNSKVRTYPRVYMKKAAEEKEDTINLSGLAVAGILALTFIEGALWGYLIRNHTAKKKGLF
jgi:hypothetical protein